MCRKKKGGGQLLEFPKKDFLLFFLPLTLFSLQKMTYCIFAKPVLLMNATITDMWVRPRTLPKLTLPSNHEGLSLYNSQLYRTKNFMLPFHIPPFEDLVPQQNTN